MPCCAVSMEGIYHLKTLNVDLMTSLPNTECCEECRFSQKSRLSQLTSNRRIDYTACDKIEREFFSRVLSKYFSLFASVVLIHGLLNGSCLTLRWRSIIFSLTSLRI